MTTDSPPRRQRRQAAAERLLEQTLFSSRWLMAPFYLGLVLVLAALVVVFVHELALELSHLLTMTSADIIVVALSLIDLSLAGNLIVIVIFAGYENFVSKLDTGGHEDRPDWMGTIDFSGLKIKVIASLVAISAVALLRALLKRAENAPGAADDVELTWLLVIHLTFVVSGVLLSLMDFIGSKTAKH